MTSLMTTHPEQPVRRRSSTPSRHWLFAAGAKQEGRRPRPDDPVERDEASGALRALIDQLVLTPGDWLEARQDDTPEA